MKTNVSSYCIFVSVISVFHLFQFAQSQCRDPVNLDTTVGTASDLESESGLILPGGLSHINMNNIPAEFANVSRTVVPISSHSRRYVHESRTASCPWDYIRNYDENRIPKNLYEVKCRGSTSVRCQICSGRTSRRRSECREVFHYVTVLRRYACNGAGEYLYIRHIEPLGSACTCFHTPRAIRRFHNGGPVVTE